jgi:hypothetical protein
MSGMNPRTRALVSIALVAGCTATLPLACGDDEPTGVRTTSDAASGVDAPGFDSCLCVDATAAPTVGPLEPDNAARAAAVIGSCVGDDRSNRMLHAMYNIRSADGFEEALYRQHVDCLASRNNGCQAVADCVGIRDVPLPDVCQNGCEGNVAVLCAGAFQRRVDCGQYGMECHSGDAPFCTPPGAVACDEASFTETCENERPRICNNDWTALGPRCGEFGLTCGAAGSCTGMGGACTSTFSGYHGPGIEYTGVSCSGANLNACVGDGLTKLPCDSVGRGFTCFERPDAGFNKAYCGLASQCGPGYDTAPSCDGDSLVICNAGRIDKVDCKSLGFSGCSVRVCK